MSKVNALRTNAINAINILIAAAVEEDRERARIEANELKELMHKKWEDLDPEIKRIALAACTLESGASYESSHVECAVRAIMGERARVSSNRIMPKK